MKRLRLVGLAVLAGVLLVFAWSSMREQPGSPGSSRAPERRTTIEHDAPRDEPIADETASAPARSELPRVRGHVVDEVEGPLAEGTVLLACEDGETIARAAIDEEGWFEGPACTSGTTCARLIHPGSRQREAWRLAAEQVHELEVEPAPRAAGHVRAAEGPLENADVFVRRGESRWATRSELEGEFMVALGDTARAAEHDPCAIESLATEPFTLTALAPGLAPLAIELAAEGREDLDLVLAPAAAPLRGRLLDPEDRPFARARVLARSLARPDEAHAVEPDAAGEFAFTSLGEGHYELRAIRDGVELARVEGEAGANLVMRATLSARGPHLVLRLHDASGLPCTRMRVDGGPFRVAWTDEEGRVEAQDVFSGSLALSLRHDAGGMREHIEVPDAEQGRRIEVDLAVDCGD